MTAASKELRSKTQPRRGLRRVEAAIYVGVSPTKFDDWVKRRVMPQPKRQDDVAVWDVRALDLAFEALPDQNQGDAASAWD